MKIIINITDETPLNLAMECVQRVISKGRIRQGGKSYDHSIFDTSDNKRIIVAVFTNNQSDTFKIWTEPCPPQST